MVKSFQEEEKDNVKGKPLLKPLLSPSSIFRRQPLLFPSQMKPSEDDGIDLERNLNGNLNRNGNLNGNLIGIGNLNGIGNSNSNRNGIGNGNENGNILSPKNTNLGPKLSKDSSKYSKDLKDFDNSWSTLVSRHKFLLWALLVLLLLCTVYLYYAISLDFVPGCEGLLGTELELCKGERERTKSSGH